MPCGREVIADEILENASVFFFMSSKGHSLNDEPQNIATCRILSLFFHHYVQKEQGLPYPLHTYLSTFRAICCKDSATCVFPLQLQLYMSN